MSAQLNSPVQEIESLEDRLDAVEFMLARMESANHETYPSAVVDRLCDGESPVLVWREYRGVDQSALAGMAHIDLTRLIEIEHGAAAASIHDLALLARALRVDLELLVPQVPE